MNHRVGLGKVQAYTTRLEANQKNLQLAALAYVWRAELGFVMPSIQSFSGSYQTLGMIAHHLNKLVKAGLLKRIGDRYLMRDACPSCFRRVCNSDCHLHMSATDFVPRRETQITTGA